MSDTDKIFVVSFGLPAVVNTPIEVSTMNEHVCIDDNRFMLRMSAVDARALAARLIEAAAHAESYLDFVSAVKTQRRGKKAAG